MKLHSILIFLIICAYCVPAFAEDTTQAELDKIPPMTEAEYREFFGNGNERNWNFSLSPSYSLLYVKDEGDVRHGAGGRLQAMYYITPNWSIDLHCQLNIHDGDSAGIQGIYGQVGLLFGARYTFLSDYWIQPYVGLAAGWVRTELDRDIDTMFVTHSMGIEPNAGVSFKILPEFWMGLDLTFMPVFLGDDKISGSFSTVPSLTFELRI